MLIAAFSGLDAMKRAYAHASGWRLYSYGAACPLTRAENSYFGKIGKSLRQSMDVATKMNGFIAHS